MTVQNQELAAKIAALPPEKRALLLEKLRQRREADREQIKPQPRKGQSFPLSFEQERMWFIHQWDPDSPLYNDRLTLCLTGDVDSAALERTLNAVVQRHESLRTTFRLVDLQPVQVIAPTLQVPLPVEDLQALPEAERTAEFHRLAREEIRRPFDLERGPLLRARLLRLSPAESVLLVTMHHIVFDGWSFGILIRDLVSGYADLASGRPLTWQALPVQYADFAVWERQWLQGEGLKTLLEYWKRQLAGVPDVLTLPSDRPRPAAPSSRGARLPVKLDQALCDDLKALSRSQGVTFFVGLLAAFGTLLSRLTGETDIVVGVPIANRNHAEIADLVGVFMNTLALRIDLSGNPTFQELLRRVHQVMLDAQAHQQLPFARLVSELQPERSISHTPLFQVSFGYQDSPLQAELDLPGLTIDVQEMRSLRETGELPPLDNGMAMFELTFHLLEAAEGVAGWVEYKTDLFDRETVQRILGYYQTLLQSACAAPETRLADLRLLPPAEFQQVLIEWNATHSPYPAERCIHTVFEERAAQMPDALAVIFEEQALTYAELNTRANQVAHYLRSLGVGPESPVGIFVERSPEMIISILGVLKAGGAYVPLDPKYPKDRLSYMLADVQPLAILTQQYLLDTAWLAMYSSATENPEVQTTPDNLAYVIYTSGSSGQPKGVLLSHRGLCKVAEAQVATFDMQPEHRVVQFSSLNFDASIFEIVMAWRVGATLCLGKAESLLPGEPLLEFLQKYRVTNITIPPSALMALPAAELPDLHTIAVAGEPCPPDLVARWAEGRRFFNLYGPTETTIWATATECFDSAAPPPIGRPIANTTLYVVDGNLQLAPVGVAGELLIGGVGLARGYLNRPALTAERFIPDPFGREPGARLYRTGDKVRWLPDGSLEFLGRLDHQVKLRGFRIELGEIETILSQHPAVRDTVVVVREEAGRRQLVAYCVAAGQPDVSDLRAFCKQHLPDYMIPAAFVLLDTLPLSPSGKVDRQALPSPTAGRLELKGARVAPRNATETLLAEIWAHLLRVENVGIHDNFFELGGDSIQSVQIAAAATQAGLRVTSRQIFEHQTIAELAAVVGQTAAIPAEQGPVIGPVPLTPIQHWFFEGASAEPQHWNQAVFLETPEALDPDALEQATTTLLAHHDALRLRFRQGDQGWEQEIAPPDASAPLHIVRLDAEPLAARQARLTARAAEAQRALNLQTGPLLQVVYFDLGSEQSGRLLMVVHHLAVDGVSWPLLMQDFWTAYRQCVADEPLALPPKTTSFQRWARSLVDFAANAPDADALAYWSRAACQATAPLPVDFPAAAEENTEASAETVQLTLSCEATERLVREAAAPEGRRAYDRLLAALVDTLRVWTGETRFQVDLESHGREPFAADLDITRTVGWFTNLYPVVFEVDADTPAAALAQRVQAQLRAVPHQGSSYGRLRYLHPVEAEVRELREMPASPLVFNYLGQLATGEWRLAAESPGALRSPRALRRHLFEVNAQVVAGQLRVEWIYSRAFHRPETVQRLANDYVERLHALVASTHRGNGHE